MSESGKLRGTRLKGCLWKRKSMGKELNGVPRWMTNCQPSGTYLSSLSRKSKENEENESSSPKLRKAAGRCMKWKHPVFLYTSTNQKALRHRASHTEGPGNSSYCLK